MREIDQAAIKQYGLSSLVLMENAGRAVAEAVLAQKKFLADGRVGVFCGTGNNGGDGLVAARHLHNAGCRVEVLLVGRAAELKPDAAANYQILKKSGYAVAEIPTEGANLMRLCRRFRLVIDAMFGVGLNRDLDGTPREVIAALNESGVRVIAVDVPSGLDATTGAVRGVCVKAFATVTFSAAKKGFFCGDGPQVTGQLAVADIGIPKTIVRQIARGRIPTWR